MDPNSISPAMAETVLFEHITSVLDADRSQSLGLNSEFVQDRNLLHEYISLKLQSLGYSPLPGIDVAVSAVGYCSGSSTPEEQLITPSTAGSSTPNTDSFGAVPRGLYQNLIAEGKARKLLSEARGPVSASTIASDLIATLRASSVALKGKYLSPVDERLQNFIDREFSSVCGAGEVPTLPSMLETLNIDRAGVASKLCVPFDRNSHINAHVSSYRVPQGILSNPVNDKRTTSGTFHISESPSTTPSFQVPLDAYIAVPQNTFASMLLAALNPPKEDLILPYTATLPEVNVAIHRMADPSIKSNISATNPEDAPLCWVSLLLSPLVCPGIPGLLPEKRMEVRCFAPGSMVANLAFLENVFGVSCRNGESGDPMLPSNDMGLRPANWTGTSGLIILAPHLRKLTKKSVGLPRWEDATERQRKEGMCWKDPSEIYHDGRAFKLVYRSREGVMITIIADSYFGYSKKEVKTEISFAANISGLAEEEHAGGCVALPAYSWARSFKADSRVPHSDATFESMCKLIAPSVYKRYFGGSDNSVSTLCALPPIEVDIKKGTEEDIAMVHQKDGVNQRIPASATCTFDEIRGICIDKKYSDTIYYVPQDLQINLTDRSMSWTHPITKEPHVEPVEADVWFVIPQGYRVKVIRHPVSKQWMIQGVLPRPLVCHKPFTVSGGGKSEISKSVMDSITSGPFFVSDFRKTINDVKEIINHDYSNRFKNEYRPSHHDEKKFRPILSEDRSLGSVIKLLTQDSEYTDEYNSWLASLDTDTLSFTFLLKALYRGAWGEDWEGKFRVKFVNGVPGHTVICQGQDLDVNYMRVGTSADGSWRNFRLRADFFPSVKTQIQDDISATVTVPLPTDVAIQGGMYVLPENRSENDTIKENTKQSVKIVSNCEYRFFQRPDDAIVPGADAKCESDLADATGTSFIANFEPVSRDDAIKLAKDVMSLEKYTEPMRKLIVEFANGGYPDYDSVVISNKPRVLADGSRTKNVRYLQKRPEWNEPAKAELHLLEVCGRLHNRINERFPVFMPIGINLPGRRLNPAEKDIKPLAVFNPIHYQELPELFMDLIPCLTGKSPSTTGAGVEGALTKGPFNCLSGIIDLNNALLSLILTQTPVYSTAAGYIGHKLKVDHDISLIAPEVFCRMSAEEREPEYLLKNGFLEKLEDFEYKGEIVPAGILGYRITSKFVKRFFARMFDHVSNLFEEEHIKPELQDMDNFVAGVKNIYESQKKVAKRFIDDGSIDEAIPPLKALIYIMVTGTYKGMNLTSPQFRKLFDRDVVLNSAWYRRRLLAKKSHDIKLSKSSIEYLKQYNSNQIKVTEALKKGINVPQIIAEAQRRHQYLCSNDYYKSLIGTIGLHVFVDEMCDEEM